MTYPTEICFSDAIYIKLFGTDHEQHTVYSTDMHSPCNVIYIAVGLDAGQWQRRGRRIQNSRWNCVCGQKTLYGVVRVIDFLACFVTPRRFHLRTTKTPKVKALTVQLDVYTVCKYMTCRSRVTMCRK